jgi:hypothetical protein
MMRLFHSVIALLLLSIPASATTYTYAGLPLPQSFPPAGQTIQPGLTGSVTFNLDTTNFTGLLLLVDGDAASLVVPRIINGNPFSQDRRYDFPVDTFQGEFSLTNGIIRNWVFNAALPTIPFCFGGSSGCNPHISAATTPDQDSVESGDFLSFTNSGGGAWTQVAAVPEPSTWAMLLIGFAGIGFASYRRRHHTEMNPSRRGSDHGA